ncbi:MAG: hypothetical protein K6B38_07840, partial [Ruminococcus sp.]|nr:hypothetical protein [Ruminococcus sp.]
RIIRHNFVGDKAKIRRRAVALQGFLTQSPAKFDEKTCMNPYVDRFLNEKPYSRIPIMLYGLSLFIPLPPSVPTAGGNDIHGIPMIPFSEPALFP